VPYLYHRDDEGNTYQYVLYEGSNDIQVNYSGVTSYGDGSIYDAMVAGIENATGKIGLQYPGMEAAGRYENFYVRYSTNPGGGQAVAPAVATGGATSETGEAATLNGTVNPNGFYTTSHFEYGTSAEYGSSTATTSLGSGTSAVSVSAVINDLEPNTVYHYRLAATNIAGTTYGRDRTFTSSLGSSAHTLYFPHIVSTSDDTGQEYTWETEICVINTSDSETLNGVFRAYNNAGYLITKIDPISVTLDPHGRREVTVGNEFTKPNLIGYIVFESDLDTVEGYAKFSSFSPEGRGEYRVAVPAVSEINTGDIYISHIASSDMWLTEVSLINTTQSEQDVTIEFDNGATTTRRLYANGHTTFKIRDIFGGDPQPDIGSAVITGANGVVGLELFSSIDDTRQLSGVLLTDHTSSTIYYPHIANGSYWWTGIVAYNPSVSDTTITITPYCADGVPLTPQSVDIGGREKYIGTADALDLPVDAAWMQIDAESPITGFELFGTRNNMQLAGYTGVGISGTKGVFAKLERDGWTGIAFVNLESDPTTVTLTAYDDSGTEIATETVGLEGHAKMVDQAQDLFTHDIGGATYITYASDREVVGFQLNSSSDEMMLDALQGM